MYPNLTPYPINALPPIIRDAVYEVRQNIGAPDALITSSALGAASLVIQDKINVRRTSYLVSPVSLFLLTLAESSERKTTVDNINLQPVRDYEASQAETLLPEQKRWRTGMTAWKAKKDGLTRAISKTCSQPDVNDALDKQLEILMAAEPKEPKVPKMILSDATPTAVKKTLHEQWPSAGVMSDEGGAVLNSRTMSQLTDFNALYGGDQIPFDRSSTRSFVLRDARLTFSLMVQPGTFLNYLAGKGRLARDSGFLARCLVAFPASTQGQRPPTNPDPVWHYVPILQNRMTEILCNRDLTHGLGSPTMTTLEFYECTKGLDRLLRLHRVSCGAREDFF